MLHAAIRDAGSSAAETVMIGDTVFDMAMGSAAGARAIGVDWGYHEPAEAARGGRVDGRPPSFDELLAALP